MGIAPYYAEALTKLCRQPIAGRAFTVGRQTMLFSPEHAVSMTGASADPATLETDSETRAGDPGYITDRAFFRLLGIEKLESIDVSDYEKASIVHDLNQPIPDNLEGIAGLIVDGSTLDNVFNPAQAMMNLSRMLMPGGVLFSINMGSNHHDPYTIPTPLWLYDYFVVNGFARVGVYVVAHRGPYRNIFAVEASTMPSGPSWTRNFVGPDLLGLMVVAEKGPDSTWDAMPIQHSYRSPEQQSAWLDGIAKAGAFDDILLSNARQLVYAPPGYRFIPAPGRTAEPHFFWRLGWRVRQRIAAI